MIRRSLAALAALQLVLVATETRASESYPRALERAFDLPCAPACTLCHTTPSGGFATANTPVGISARRAGLACCDTGGLIDVWTALEAAGTDSDADGVPDLDELRTGTDPNALDGGLECLPPPESSSCALSAERERGAPWPVLGLLGSLTLLGFRRARTLSRRARRERRRAG